MCCKRWAPCAAVVLAIILQARGALCAQPGPKKPQRTPVDRVVAVLDADIITLQELMAQAQGPLAELEAQPAGDGKDTSIKDRRQQILLQVLDAEISERLLTREVNQNRERLGVTDKDIDAAVDEVKKLNNVNAEQLQAALYGQGLTFGEYRNKLRAQLERTRLVQLKVQGKVQIKEGEAKRRCLERQRMGQPQARGLVCASHILLRLVKDADTKEVQRQEARAKELRKRLLAGEHMAALAQEHSDEPGVTDGSLGCFGKGEMVEAFEAAAFALTVGETSEVVRTPFGLHLITVTGRPEAHAPTACESAADLNPYKNEVYQEEMGRQMELWMQELKEAAFVEIRL